MNLLTITYNRSASHHHIRQSRAGYLQSCHRKAKCCSSLNPAACRLQVDASCRKQEKIKIRMYIELAETRKSNNEKSHSMQTNSLFPGQAGVSRTRKMKGNSIAALQTALVKSPACIWICCQLNARRCASCLYQGCT